jgi:NADH dehydrogenase
MSKVLVLGGGFAGLSAARHLARHGGKDISLRLIDQRELSVFSPLLPDLISGRMHPGSITAPIAPFCRQYGIEFTRAAVNKIIPDEGRVLTDQAEFSADYILLALGCVTNYFGNDEMKRRTFGLKSVEEGLEIYARLCGMIDNARAGGRPGGVVVVGGGYTGFESASHAAHLVHRRAKLPFKRIAEVCPVVVVEKGDTVMGNVSENVRSWAVKLMRGYGIEILANTSADVPDDQGRVKLSNGRTMENALVIWATGVTPGEEIASFNPERIRGRVVVDEHLRVKGHERMFAAGDVAGACRPGQDQPMRMGIQFSLSAGDCAARNLLSAMRKKPLKVFDPWDPGYIVPLSPRKAAGLIVGHEMHGTLPSLLHYFMCIFRSWRWRERFAILKDLL